MESMCNKSDLLNENQVSENAESHKIISRSESPVFKCFNPKSNRINRVDSSDYDIPSYQVNQSAKSKTSSKHDSESSDLFLPFTPNFSPIPSAVQFQTPSVHTLSTVFKSMKQTSNSFFDKQVVSKKSENVFQSLGMTDKDISWVSSMASPPPSVVPGSEFNTVEKATFFPEEKFQNIQPRALFSPTYDENFGCKPLSFSSESEDDEAYKTNIRLSDVCATLNQLEVKSFEQSQSEGVNKETSQSNKEPTSPVIKTKKKKLERSAKKQNPILVKSPQSADDNYNFSIGESITPITPDRTNSTGSGQNFIEDDSFQSMSFSCLDELCKTLVNSTNSTRSIDCDQTITNQNESLGTLKSNVKKFFYKTKTKADVQEIAGETVLCASTQALEEGDMIPIQSNKLKKKFTEKGIVTLDELNSNGRVDAVKRLNSDQCEGKVENVKKLKTEDNSCNWEEGKDLCLSQHSFNDCEMFRIVENLEKSLGNQNFDKSKTFVGGNENLECNSVTEADGKNQGNLDSSNSNNFSVGFVTASGSKMLISEKALSKAKENFEKLMEETEESCHLNSQIGLSNASGKKIAVSFESLEKAKKLMFDCDQDGNEETDGNHVKKSTSFQENKTLKPDIKMNLSKELFKRENIVSPEPNIRKKCKKDLKIRSSTPLKEASASASNIFNKIHFPNTESTSGFDSNLSLISSAKSMKFPFGFSTAAGTKVKISEEAIEKAKAMMLKDLTDDIIEEELKTPSTEFSSAVGTEVNVSTEDSVKNKDVIPKKFIENCDEENSTVPFFGFSATAETKRNVSEKAVEKPKALISRDEIKFSENDVVEEHPTENNFSSVSMGFLTAAGIKVKVSKEALEKARALMADEEFNFTKSKVESERETITPFKNTFPEVICNGFSTAAGTEVNVSKEALEKAKTLIYKDEMNFTEGGSQEEKPTASLNNFPMGFSTAAGTKVTISKKALEKARALMADEELNFTESKMESKKETNKSLTNAQVPCYGFSTASGTKVSVSKEALEKAKTLIYEDEMNFAESGSQEEKPTASLNNFPMGFSTAAGAKVTVSKKALEKARALMADEELNFTESKMESKKETNKSLTNAQVSCYGFSTALGTKVKVTKESLEKAKSLIYKDEMNFTEGGSQGEKPTAGLNTFPMGFSTAAGTKVTVSKKALEKARALMADEELNFTESKVESKTETSKSSTNAQVSCYGFSTASGTKVSVSKEALEKAKTLIYEDVKTFTEDGSQEEKPTATLNNFPMGFSTAAGTKVTVSKKALEKARALMADEELNFTESKMESKKETNKFSTNAQVPSYGFSTASGTKVGVSKEALEKAKALMAEESGEKPEEVLKTPLMNFTGSNFGFSTAAGTKVNVSKEAMEKAKHFILKEEKEFTQNFLKCDEDQTGFNELSSKTNNSSVTTEKMSGSANSESSEVPMLGFSTALGNKINVSVEALKKAKSLMSEEEITTKSIEPGGNKENITLQESKEVMEGKSLTSINTKSVNVEDEWDEIIPSWLHVYNTSPSIVSDRTDLVPMVVEDYDKSTTCDKEYIVKSPVLGSHDRFTKKRKRKKLDFGCEEKNSLDSQTENKKNTKICESLDFSAPFKRIKSEENDSKRILSNVKEERARARAEQEKVAKEKQKVKPVKGSHLLKKTKEKQMTWLEAVNGSLPEVYTKEQLISMNVKEDVFNVDVTNAVDFKFNGVDFFGYCCLTNTAGFQVGDGCTLIPDDDNKFGVEEFKNAFLASNGVQPNLLPFGWLENHYKWIVWKLSHYEKSFPLFFAGNCLTPHNVMLQLKYRYDREIDGSERSALRKILERDDTPMKRLVLCICDIKKVVKEDITEYILSLTDGWYSCPARADPALTRLVEKGKVTIGTKLITQGAALVNCEQGISPLEISEDTYLKLSTNSLRRVRWDAKLGFQKNPENITVSLGSVLPQGGNISRLNVIIVRVYPMLYMEKTTDGCHVTRNLRSEEKAEAEHQRIQEKRMEAILNEINLEMENQKKNFENSENLSQLMENNSDPSGELMSLSQKQNIVCTRNDRRAREIREKIEQKLKKEKLGKRNVSEFFRIRVVDLKKPDYNNPATLSIWNPGEEVVRVLSEGKAIAITNISIGSTSRSYKPVQLNTTRSTQFKELNKCVKYPARKLTHLKDVPSKACPVFEEVDLVGVVTRMQEVAHGSRLSQMIYLTDLDFNFVGILFWGSCKNYGWENVFKLYSTVACSNLLWKKSYSVQEVPLLHVNESSVFTENPKHSYLKKELERLKSKIPQDKSSFFAKFDEELTDKLEESKWRNNSNRSSLSNDSSLCRSRLADEPSASSTPIRPCSSLSTSNEAEPSPIQKRMEKLQSYGEPPPLLPLIISNKGRKMKRKI